MGTVVVRTEGLGKRYRIGANRAPYGRLTETLWDAATRPFQRGNERAVGDQHIWALKEVSLEVAEGEVLGVIGANGAGKSTLLKILTRITPPTEGWAELRGRVGSLLEVGTGFHPELTGRENIRLAGTILGMRSREIAAHFDDIVEFAELARFLDTPVKRYSSGMYVRLAFAVAAHLEPEILLIDEVLAVGDAAFQRKCLGKMSEVTAEGRTVVFVSHNMGAIGTLCDRAAWIDAGRIHMEGPADQVVAEYLTGAAEQEGQFESEEGTANPGVDAFKLHAVRIRDDAGRITSRLDARRSFSIEIEYALHEALEDARIGFVLTTADGAPVLEAYDVDDPATPRRRPAGRYRIACVIPADRLNSNLYSLSFNAGVPNRINLCRLPGLLVFDVEHPAVEGAGLSLRRRGVMSPSLEWRSSDV